MFQSHLVLLVVFSSCVSIVFGALAYDDVRQQSILAGKMFAGFVGAALLIGWLMSPFPI